MTTRAALLLACLSIAGCALAIPVRAVPTDEPILVAAVGTQSTDAAGVTTHNANLPQPDPAKFPPAQSTTAGWGAMGNVLLAAVSALAGGGGAAVWLMPLLGKLRKALSITATLADANADATTDAQVAVNKHNATMAQEAAGVRDLTQKARGKA